jgi:hypothetical protein
MSNNIKKNIRTNVDGDLNQMDKITKEDIKELPSLIYNVEDSFRHFSAKDISTLFKRLEKLGYSDFAFEIKSSYGDEEIKLTAQRIENDKEFNRRTGEENKRARITEENEKRQYEELKKKFEKNLILGT